MSSPQLLSGLYSQELIIAGRVLAFDACVWKVTWEGGYHFLMNKQRVAAPFEMRIVTTQYHDK